MEEPLESLRGLVDAIHPLTEDEWSHFAAMWIPFECGRKVAITRQGEKERYLYFVLSGVQRVYYFDESGREATLVFTYAPSFGGVIDSCMMQTPSLYFYESLTPSLFLRADYNDLDVLMKQHHGIETFIRKGLTVALAGVLERLMEIQCFTSEENFRILLKRSPHILQLVPHKYLANYIGIDATNFSKLMNRVKV